MTEALYLADAYRLTCEAVVLSTGPEGVVLDRTVFYPTGGGQPGDPGVLRWDGGEAAVATAVKGEAGGILHVLAEGAPPPPVGAAVTAEIDAAFRDGCRRVHTCLHLLSVVIPLPVSGGAITPQKGRLDFDMPEAPSDKAALAAALTALIDADHAVSDTWITDEELAANPGLVKTMSVAPPTGQGRVRLVRIGDEAAPVDLQPCGGAHVRSTTEIGPIRIGKIEKKGARNRRVYVHLAP